MQYLINPFRVLGEPGSPRLLCRSVCKANPVRLSFYCTDCIVIDGVCVDVLLTDVLLSVCVMSLRCRSAVYITMIVGRGVLLRLACTTITL